MQNGEESYSKRRLNEYPTFIRHSKAIPIIRKITSAETEFMSNQVSSRKPFGIPTNIKPQETGDIILYWQKGTGPYHRNEISVGIEMIDKWNVVTSYVGYDHAGNPGKDGRRRVLSKIDILPPGTICTETYLVIGSYDSKTEAENLVTYMKSKFFRFLVSQFMYSHHITKESYSLVPILHMDTPWTDEELYQKYDLSQEEIAFIESKIRPME
jgi:site-specific DNA-methyltransferase (adenine-specific)